MKTFRITTSTGCTQVRRFLAGLVFMNATACSAASEPSEWAGTITDSAGVLLVTNPEQGLWTESNAWTVVEDFRIGEAGGDPDYQFGQVGSIAVSSSGDIFVSDRQASEVRVFSRSGTYLRTIGEPGSGPGQFAPSAMEIMMSAGDTLIVPDVSNRRISRFLPDGTFAGSAVIGPAVGQPMRFNWNPASHHMAVQVRPIGSESRPVTSTTDAIRLVETSGTMTDTLLDLPSGGLFQETGLRFFTPEPMWDIGDSLTVLSAINSEYRILLHDRNGALRRVITRPFKLRAIGDRDIRALFVYLDRRWLDAGVPPERLPRNHSLVGFADFFPAFYTFQTGYRGTLWVQPVQSPADLSDDEIEGYNFLEDFGASGWDVFDAEGKYLGVVTMPHRFQPRLFLEDRIYGVWRDELDVQYVVRLKIVDA